MAMQEAATDPDSDTSFFDCEEPETEMTSNSVATIVDGQVEEHQIDSHNQISMVTEVQSLPFHEQPFKVRNTFIDGDYAPSLDFDYDDVLLRSQTWPSNSAMSSLQRDQGTFQFTDESGGLITLSRSDGQLEVNVADQGDIGKWKGFELK